MSREESAMKEDGVPYFKIGPFDDFCVNPGSVLCLLFREVVMIGIFSLVDEVLYF